MHMNKFPLHEITDIRSKLSCYTLLCFEQHGCIEHSWCVHQHTQSFLLQVSAGFRNKGQKSLFKPYYITYTSTGNLYVEIFIPAVMKMLGRDFYFLMMKALYVPKRFGHFIASHWVHTESLNTSIFLE